MAVDSDGLSNNHIVEVNVKTESKGPHNPHNNTFVADETVLRSELMARRPYNYDTQRHWHVRCDNTKNRSQGDTGWRLMPGQTTPLYARSEAMYLRRAGFVKNHLWVTPFNPFEKFPGGDFPNQVIVNRQTQIFNFHYSSVYFQHCS
jgi:primary-amine oxidase